MKYRYRIHFLMNHSHLILQIQMIHLLLLLIVRMLHRTLILRDEHCYLLRLLLQVQRRWEHHLDQPLHLWILKQLRKMMMIQQLKILIHRQITLMVHKIQRQQPLRWNQILLMSFRMSYRRISFRQNLLMSFQMKRRRNYLMKFLHQMLSWFLHFNFVRYSHQLSQDHCYQMMMFELRFLQPKGH